MIRLDRIRVLVTRAAGQFDAVAALIRERGGIPLPFPCLAVQCLPDNIRSAFAGLAQDTTLLFSSVNGVQCAAAALGDAFASACAARPVVVVGEQTAAALRAHGIEPAWVASQASQEGLIDGFVEHGLPGDICFLRAEEGREVLQDALQARGVAVHMVHAYRTVCPDDNPVAVVQALNQNEIDAVLLGSSRTARHYAQRINDPELADRPAIVAISEQVADAARDAGLSVQAVAKQASFDAMLDALGEHLADQQPTSLPEETRP